MDVILLERIGKLGNMGEVVKVKNGYARNYLFPQHKALRATEANRAKFERDRVVLEARRRGVIVRPLGDVIVLMPPLSTSKQDLKRLVQVVAQSIRAATPVAELGDGEVDHAAADLLIRVEDDLDGSVRNVWIRGEIADRGKDLGDAGLVVGAEETGPVGDDELVAGVVRELRRL